MLGLGTILDDTPRFSFFNELVSIPTAPVLQHDLFKINKLLDDIISYLLQVLRVFEKFKHQFAGELNWFYQGKDQLIYTIKNIDSIDEIIGKLLNAVDDTLQPQSTPALLGKFENATDILLDVKKYSILSKKKLDVAINFRDLQLVMESLSFEIEQCEMVIVRLFLELSLDQNNQVDINTKTLEEVLLRMGVQSTQVRIPGQSQSSSPGTFANVNDSIGLDSSNSTAASNGGSVNFRLPTFSALEDEMYETWLSLQTKVTPLKVSLEFLPMRIAEFEHLYSAGKSEINALYADLLSKWDSLGVHLKAIKHEAITKKWKLVFTFLIDKGTAISSQLVRQAAHDTEVRKNHEFASAYRLCSSAVNVLLQSNSVSETSTILQFNEKLLPNWYLLNDTLSVRTKDTSRRSSWSGFQSNSSGSNTSELKKPNKRMSAIQGLRPFSIVKSLPSPESLEPIENGYGIHLGIGVDQIDIPFSVKLNKVRNFFRDTPSDDIGSIRSPRELLLSQLKNEEDDDTDDDTATLVTLKRTEDKLTMPTNTEIWQYLRTHNTLLFLLTTKVPIMVYNYHQMGYVLIKQKPTRKTGIPRICPDHPALALLRDGKTQVLLKMQLQSPVIIARSLGKTGPVLVLRSPSPVRDRASTVSEPSPTSSSSFSSEMASDGPVMLPETVFKKPSRKPSLIETSQTKAAHSSRSSIPITPPLEFGHALPTWRSTSPERPGSALGSRYDLQHLIHKLESPKQQWR